LGPLEPDRPKVLADRHRVPSSALNLLTEQLDVDRLAITTWSPDNGLSLLLLTESVTFAPFVFVGAILVDMLIVGVQHSVYVVVTSEFLLALVYVSLAIVIREKLGLRLSQIGLSDGAKLLVIPAGAAFAALAYCTVLYICGALPSNDLLIVMFNFALGDILGITTIIAAITFLSLSVALATVYREEPADGTAYYATLRLLAASRILLFPSAMVKFNSLAILAKLYNAKNKHDPLYFLNHKYYLSKKFTLRQRVQAAMDHRNHESKEPLAKFIERGEF
jgi:hypothetical protein